MRGYRGIRYGVYGNFSIPYTPIPYTLYLIFCTLYPYTLYLLIPLFLSSCGEEDYTPKPRGFFRIELPEKQYLHYQSECPFSFDYPVYSTVEKDTKSMAEPCWLNLEFPRFKGTLHISYKPVNGNIEQYLNDARELTNKHIAKADAINEIPIINHERRIYGLIYDVEGSGAASPLQFFVTDSNKHFLRGALYFNVKPNNDSLQPVIQFIRKDIDRLVESLEWVD